MAETQESSEERSVPELVREITAQSAALARKELELAESELTMKGNERGSARACSGAPASSACSGSHP
jgi:hypothetical protein